MSSNAIKRGNINEQYIIGRFGDCVELQNTAPLMTFIFSLKIILLRAQVDTSTPSGSQPASFLPWTGGLFNPVIKFLPLITSTVLQLTDPSQYWSSLSILLFAVYLHLCWLSEAWWNLYVICSFLLLCISPLWLTSKGMLFPPSRSSFPLSYKKHSCFSKNICVLTRSPKKTPLNTKV